jgi:hypothetical protein
VSAEADQIAAISDGESNSDFGIEYSQFSEIA